MGSVRSWYVAVAGVLLLLIVVVGAVKLPAQTHARFWIVRPDPEMGARTAEKAASGTHSFRLPARVDEAGPAIVQRLSVDHLEKVRGHTVLLQAMVSGTTSPQLGRLELVSNADAARRVFAASDTWQRRTVGRGNTRRCPISSRFAPPRRRKLTRKPLLR